MRTEYILRCLDSLPSPWCGHSLVCAISTPSSRCSLSICIDICTTTSNSTVSARLFFSKPSAITLHIKEGYAATQQARFRQRAALQVRKTIVMKFALACLMLSVMALVVSARNEHHCSKFKKYKCQRLSFPAVIFVHLALFCLNLLLQLSGVLAENLVFFYFFNWGLDNSNIIKYNVTDVAWRTDMTSRNDVTLLTYIKSRTLRLWATLLPH